MSHLFYFCLALLCFHARLFVDALWSPTGKGLASWLSFVMSNCDVVTFLVVSWVGVVLDCIDFRSVPSFLLHNHIHLTNASWPTYQQDNSTPTYILNYECMFVQEHSRMQHGLQIAPRQHESFTLITFLCIKVDLATR